MSGKPFELGNKFGKGRRGAKNRLATRVLEDLQNVWDEPCRPGTEITNGVAALRIMAKQHPAEFCKLYCNLVPKEFWVESSTLSDMSDEEVDKVILRLRDEVQQEEAANVIH